MADADRKLANGAERIDFATDPSRYRHWKISIDGDVATLVMDVDENAPLFEGYESFRRGRSALRTAQTPGDCSHYIF